MNGPVVKVFMGLCFLLSVSLLHAQSAKLDSLYTLLKSHPEEDTVRVNLMMTICYYEYTSNPEKNKALAEEAIVISKKLNFTNGVGYATRYIALYSWVKGN